LCGNDMVDATEACDGADLGGADCSDEGFFAGELACAPGCDAFDTTACHNCGNGEHDAPEICDGVALQDQDCTTLGYVDGLLGCVPTCDAFEATGCAGVVCGVDPPG